MTTTQEIEHFTTPSNDMDTKYYKVAGITIRLDSDLPIEDKTFSSKFKLFETDGPGEDNIHLMHHFSLPKIQPERYGKQVYKKSPWIIYKDDDRWVYILEVSPDPEDYTVRQISFVNNDHTRMEIYNGDLVKEAFATGGLGALTMAPTDQILLARLLADRSGCYLHSDGIKIDEEGYLFVGHSGAGKSTIATLLQDKGEILCDDRMIVRKWQDGYQIHGNWSHGTLPIVSASSAPLKGIFFLEQSQTNQIIPVETPMASIAKLLGCLIKPMVTKDWWEKVLNLVEDLAGSVPCYQLRFDKSGDIYHRLKEL